VNTALVGNREIAIEEVVADATPFAKLVHFRKTEPTGVEQPRVLIVAPLSGHFATLLRSTVQTMVNDHDVCITDWLNAREVPDSAGRFGFSEYMDHVIRFLSAIGPGAHVLAVCQPCVHTLAAVSMMAEDRHPMTPRSMTLMGGPVDVRINPTAVNQLATTQPIEWFERNLITTVPWRFKGAGRQVYPGFVQLFAFMQMNMERHESQHRTMYEHLANGELEKAQVIKDFYDEYFAVLDLAAEFYLETVKIVFQDAQLARGTLTHRGRKVNPGAITNVTLLTVEGERDDVCALGQTLAAHDLCTGLKPHRKRHHVQAGVGHYGVFSGKKWENQIYPMVRNHILGAQ
jgi:polyhydroxyalkanoate depolymerase